MKSLILTTLLCFSALVSIAQASPKQQNIKKLMELTGAGQLGVDMVKNMLGSFQTSFAEVPQSFWDDFMKEVSADGLVAMVIPIYDKYYSEADIQQLIAFYETPVGKKSIQVLPMIMKESMAAGEIWGTEIGERVIKRLKEKGYDPGE